MSPENNFVATEGKTVFLKSCFKKHTATGEVTCNISHEEIMHGAVRLAQWFMFWPLTNVAGVRSPWSGRKITSQLR